MSADILKPSDSKQHRDKLERIMANDELIAAANDRLQHRGLCLVGRSSKSGSTYWALSRDDGMLRIRVSDHAVVYQSSDCEICCGVSQDDDVRLDLAADISAAIDKAVGDLVMAEIARHRADAEDAEESADDAEAFVRKHWGHLA